MGVVAPAGPVDPESLEKGLRVLQRMGFKPLVGKYVLSRHRYLAGKDEDRASDLMAMFENPKVKAIFCARGGYGVNRLLPLLKPKKIRKHPKILVGASDITLLLLYLLQKCSLAAFHGPMVAGNFGRHPMRKSKKQFFDLLTGKREGRKISSRQARILNPGTARGPITGGCLTLLCRSLKTPYEIQTQGRILLIEDVNEPPYRIDGMLWQLKTAGKLKDVKGIILGEMINCHAENRENGSLGEIYREVFAGLEVPIVTGFPIGHGREMWTLPLGVKATLDTGSRSIEFQDRTLV
ncbi:MAG: LD-carboxypeptidase [Nitrospinaceae bacterium]